MFRRSQLERYFNRAGSSKSRSKSSATSSSGHETSANLVSSRASISANGELILLGSSSESNASVENVREFPASDPRYVHSPRLVAKRSCETTDSICNQPRKCRVRCSNPAITLITPERMAIPKSATVIDLSTDPLSNLVAEVGNDDGPSYAWNLDQEEQDPDVLAWIAAQQQDKDHKVSYEATRKFQEGWAAKLPWASCVKGRDGLYDFVKCTICSIFEVREKNLMPKWDTLKKHGGKRKAKCNLPARGVKAGQWYIDNKHLVNERRYVFNLSLLLSCLNTCFAVIC
jgi:hypothetical protein